MHPKSTGGSHLARNHVERNRVSWKVGSVGCWPTDDSGPFIDNLGATRLRRVNWKPRERAEVLGTS